MLTKPLADYRKGPTPEEPFQHFSGIQFYLAHDFSLVRGHTYYANSAWGLTSISQAQFRGARPTGPYRGVISVDIGAWSKPRRIPDGENPRRPDEPAWKRTADDLAGEIWQQITTGITDGQKHVPVPIWYHIDESVHFDSCCGTPNRNDTPYMLTLPGEWEKRPGTRFEDKDKPPAKAPRKSDNPWDRDAEYSGFDYRVARALIRRGAPQIAGIVLAGSYMKTHTRLATMEAANESARHAVSAILRHSDITQGRVPQWCRYYNPEDDELADLGPLKNLDKKLLKLNLPHLVDILELERMLLRDGPPAGDHRAAAETVLNLFRDPNTLLQRLGGGGESGLDALLARARAALQARREAAGG